jgi:Na+-translocating ferredoxin:NAD+ oxidoreductase subunit G
VSVTTHDSVRPQASAGVPEGSAGATPPSGAPHREMVPAWRLIMTLAVAGGLAGLLIVTVHQWTEPRIMAHRAAAIAAAVDEVLQTPERTETLFIWEGALTAQPPATADTARLDRVWVGYDGSGTRVGYAIIGGEAGFQDIIRLMFGYEPATKRVLGMRILESKETPGLGDKIFKDSAFVGAFRTAEAPMIPTKPGTGTGGAREVDTITGATISARTVINIINNRITALQPLLDAVAAQPAAGVAGTAAAAAEGGSR